MSFIETDEDFEYTVRQDKATCRYEKRKTGMSKKQAKKECNLEVGTSKVGGFFRKTSFVLPRASALGLMRLNFRGMASKLSRIETQFPSEFKKVLQKWKNVGGSKKSIKKALLKGKVKKPLACGKKCKKKIANFKQFSSFNDEFYYPTGVEEVGVAGMIAIGSGIVTSLMNVVKGVSSTKNEKKAMELAEANADKGFDLAEKQLVEENKEKKQKTFLIVGGSLIAVSIIAFIVIKKMNKN
jgi:hypothetical protein